MRGSLKVLIAVDGSESSEAVIDAAVRLPWSESSQILILGVAEMPSTIMAGPLPMPGTYYQEWENALVDQAEANVTGARDSFVARVGKVGLVSTCVVKGNTKEAIIDEAHSFGADLIMIGTHGYNAMERMWLGSVSRTVSAHAGCSVVIVRADPGAKSSAGAMKLLVAIDGSRFSDAAVAEVASRHWPDGSEVRLITAIHLPFVPTPETWALSEDYYARAEKENRDQAEAALSRAIETIVQSNSGRTVPLTCHGEAVLGHPEEVILSMAQEWGADLILLGSHGHRALERFLLGSVSQAVAWHAPCSVEIVRSEPAAQRGRDDE
jgi:nucleotide-binding universal stress UspA family protein